MSIPTVKVGFGARMAVASLAPDERHRLFEAVERLYETAPQDWPADQVRRLAGPEPRYVLQLPPYYVFLRLSPLNEPEIHGLLHQDTVQFYQETAGAKGNSYP